jgi:hypothetical protein
MDPTKTPKQDHPGKATKRDEDALISPHIQHESGSEIGSESESLSLTAWDPKHLVPGQTLARPPAGDNVLVIVTLPFTTFGVLNLSNEE